ncbi:Hypothetical protein GOX2420 [Gluconobacter oxydans 621H]|uniref:Uncharacterized protein n=1 Tax=Gluconobacter oxydans (strain 621H) TaxID=290633 RepID=Q5FN96_GLUOX|nr:Hypothetical protein GOX2420 [Gluconobacter oxydans 621H]
MRHHIGARDAILCCGHARVALPGPVGEPDEKPEGDDDKRHHPQSDVLGQAAAAVSVVAVVVLVSSAVTRAARLPARPTSAVLAPAVSQFGSSFWMMKPPRTGRSSSPRAAAS